MYRIHPGFRLVCFGVALILLPPLLGWNLVRGGEKNPAWQAEWEKTVAAAKKEGRLVLHGGAAYELVFREFHNRYPEIEVISVPGSGGASRAQRIMTERRADQFLTDLYLSGSGTPYKVFYKGKILDPIKSALILPEVLDQSKWWGGKHFYHDDESRYILSFNGVPQSYFAYNTKLVNPDGIKSYWDFLDPKWKGKIVSYDPTMGGAVSGVLMFLYRNGELGPEFIRRFLTEMDLTATRNSRLLVDWLAVGKFSISALAPPDRAGIFEGRKQGLPINIFDVTGFKEGVPLSTSNGNIVLLNRAPHPNAARVAINWLLSREGQRVYQKFNPDQNSLRIDIPKDNMSPRARRGKGVNYHILAGPGFKDLDPVVKIVKEVWRKRK